jgi:hypothetical protein
MRSLQWALGTLFASLKPQINNEWLFHEGTLCRAMNTDDIMSGFGRAAFRAETGAAGDELAGALRASSVVSFRRSKSKESFETGCALGSRPGWLRPWK